MVFKKQCSCFHIVHLTARLCPSKARLCAKAKRTLVRESLCRRTAVMLMTINAISRIMSERMAFPNGSKGMRGMVQECQLAITSMS